MATAFLTGITGQDGRYLAENLIAEKHSVHGLVRELDERSHSLQQDHPNVVLHVGDLADAAGLKRIVLDVEPDEIYNLAALSSVAQSWKEPERTAAITGLPVATLLQSAWELQARGKQQVRFVQASSSEIFGNPRESPQDELTPINPTSPYGAAKAYAQHMVGVYRRRGLFASSCILYNHESPLRPENFVVRKITAGVARISTGAQAELTLGTLDVTRDWGWAPDYVEALQLAVRHEIADDYVIATGEEHTVADVVAVAFAAVGIDDWERYTTTDPRFTRPVEITSMCGDSTKAQMVLGWKPSVTFEQIVERLVAHDLSLLDKNPQSG